MAWYDTLLRHLVVQENNGTITETGRYNLASIRRQMPSGQSRRRNVTVQNSQSISEGVQTSVNGHLEKIQALLKTLENQISKLENFEAAAQRAAYRATEKIRPMVKAMLAANYHAKLKIKSGKLFDACVNNFYFRISGGFIQILMQKGLDRIYDKGKYTGRHTKKVNGKGRGIYAQAGFFRKYRDFFDIGPENYPKLQEAYVEAYQEELNDLIKGVAK